MNTCCFLGHRNIANKEKVASKLLLVIEELIEKNYHSFIFGNYGDFDEIVLNVCLKLKQKYNFIKLFLSVSNVNLLFKNNFNNQVEIVSYKIENLYFKRRISFNNRKMIDESSLLICYLDERKIRSNTKNIVSYARKTNKKVINIFEV